MIEAIDGGVVVTGADDIDLVSLMALKGALKLEVFGMKRRGPSAHSIAKRRLGIGGSKVKVLEALKAEIERRKAAR